METRLTVLSLLGSAGLFLFVLELVRRRQLKEKYSLIWLFAALSLLMFSVSKDLMNRLSQAMGIYYAPSAFFLLAFLFIMLIALQFSVVISRLSDRNKVLTQEVALLKLRVEEMERKPSPPAPLPAPTLPSPTGGEG